MIRSQARVPLARISGEVDEVQNILNICALDVDLPCWDADYHGQVGSDQVGTNFAVQYELNHRVICVFPSHFRPC